MLINTCHNLCFCFSEADYFAFSWANLGTGHFRNTILVCNMLVCSQIYLFEKEAIILFCLIEVKFIILDFNNFVFLQNLKFQVDGTFKMLYLCFVNMEKWKFLYKGRNEGRKGGKKEGGKKKWKGRRKENGRSQCPKDKIFLPILSK